MKKYKHIFFDLDHTLWDTDKNAEESLREIHHELSLTDHGLNSFESFHSCYKGHNERLWGLYSENKVGQEAVRINRFRFTLEDFSINNYELAIQLSEEFIKRTPYKTYLIENTIQILEYISASYPVSIITNGFKESQGIKLKNSGLADYFSHIFISEEIGYNKPDSRIFEHALKITGIDASEGLMIGDNYEADIKGALAANIDQVYFTIHPGNEAATYRISALDELRKIL
jgi:putative hydrolase of the HAD superfamily